MGCTATPEKTTPVTTSEPTAQEFPVETPANRDDQFTPKPVIQIKPTAPKQYVVQQGDTLWDISNKFLKDPWVWPEIWYVNPQIRNPHLIYPGDVISLFYLEGRPYVKVSDGPRVRSAPSKTRLSPKIRINELDQKDNVLPVQAIRQFIIRPKVVTKDQLENAPYIVGSEDNSLIYGAGDIVYVRNLEQSSLDNRYSIFRAGKALRDPATEELLGYEAIPVGDVSLLKRDEPATMKLTRTEREALLGDRLMPFDSMDEDRTFFPRAPSKQVAGTVISLADAISQIGIFQVAIINLGTRDGIEKGHVLAIFESGRVIPDPYAKASLKQKVTLPDQRAGVMMVFRAFYKVSYALIMDANRPIRIGNTVRTPYKH